jgi:hypothetical protein
MCVCFRCLGMYTACCLKLVLGFVNAMVAHVSDANEIIVWSYAIARALCAIQCTSHLHVRQMPLGRRVSKLRLLEGLHSNMTAGSMPGGYDNTELEQ